ncbi:glutamate receptor 2.7, partial [Phtheirospermum japonicum]
MHFFAMLSFSLLLVSPLISLLCNAQTNTTFQVGVVLDVDSLVGRIGLTSLSLAASDFYSVNRNYSTRLVLHVRDSRRRVTGAAASAFLLLKDTEVDAIIGPQSSAQANFVIGLGDTANVPIISFSATSPSLHPQTPFFVQTALHDAAQVDSIAAVVKYFGWSQVVLVYEDSDYGNGILPYLSNAFQEVNARVSYRCVIPVSANDDFILKELYNMKTMQTRVFVVHVSSSLASKLFPRVKEAEMLSEGYAWIVTSGLMDLFYSLDSNVIESMQGVLGMKPLVPGSRKLKSTTLYGLWAYDTFWALATAAEKIGFKEPSLLENTNSTNMFITKVSQTGPKLLRAMRETTFRGLGGNFRLVNNGQLEPSSFQILNVVGKKTREVGIWTPE